MSRTVTVMRLFKTTFLLALLQLTLMGCATPTLAPREYLDEDTAATITMVAEPWIFASERSSAASAKRDFLSLYAIDVNRMGDHRQYLAVLQWWPPEVGAAAAPRLTLETQGTSHSLQATREQPRSLGIAQPLAGSSTEEGKWWYFEVDKQLLANVAAARDLRASFAIDGEPTAYTMWRDGSQELTELTAVLP